VNKRIEIEDIDDMRRRAGIVDAELWTAIRALRFGDQVRLTFLGRAGSHAAETVRVRITRIRGNEYRGKVLDQSTSGRLCGVHAGLAIAFTASQIHSIAAMPRPSRQVTDILHIQNPLDRG
jgi:hypothetical protein